MNDLETVSPDAETQNPAPEAESPEVATPEAAEVEAESVSDTDKSLKQMQRRIDKRTADVYRERAQNEQLRARLAELEAKSGPTEKTQQGEANPVELAREISRIERFTEKSNSLVAEGAKKHTDYMDALKDLSAEVGSFVERNGAPSPFMDVVLEVSDKPAELLYHLGKNPDIAADLADLSPIKLAKRLARIESELTDKATPKTSNAPKPLEPVKGKASDSELGPGLSDAEWFKRREAQLKAQRER